MKSQAKKVRLVLTLRKHLVPNWDLARLLCCTPIQVGEKFLNNALVWSVVSAPEQRGTLYEFHECLLYATQFSNTEVRQPALPLNPGVVYSAAAWVSFNGQGKVVTGEFCLITQPDGSSKVHQIEYNDGWQYGACYLKQ
ncbi:MAG: hypothetical protein HC848_03755 [Limnobacter sp.]|nr:hypothetical protein [Limnobacter sp.]